MKRERERGGGRREEEKDGGRRKTRGERTDHHAQHLGQ